MSFQTAFTRLANEQKSTEAPSHAASPITKPGTQEASSEPVVQPTATQAQASAPSPHKAAITTHILDQTTGRPAAGVPVYLHNDSNEESTHSYLQRMYAFKETDKIIPYPIRLRLSAYTDADGRITSWNQVLLHTRTPRSAEGSDRIDKVSIVNGVATPDANTLLAAAIADQRTLQAEYAAAGQNTSAVQTWHLVFKTGVYFEGKTMWDEVDLVLNIDPDDSRGHWHVPLLLGPWGYTTYRGS